MTTRDELVKMMREDDLQAWVIDVAHLRRWTVAHFRPAQNKRGDGRLPVAADGKGFPDLVLVRERVVFAELKSQRGNRSAEQVVWGDNLLAAGAEYHVWRPSDMDDIEKVLR